MEAKNEWRGSTDALSGVAVFEVANTRAEIPLEKFADNLLISRLLRESYYAGVRYAMETYKNNIDRAVKKAMMESSRTLAH